VTISATGWYQAGHAASSLPTVRDLDHLSSHVEATSLPDFVALTEVPGGILACGAVGAMAFALEDDSDLARAVAIALGDRAAKSVLDLVAGYSMVAEKVGSGFAPHGGLPGQQWQRPIFVEGSAALGQI